MAELLTGPRVLGLLREVAAAQPGRTARCEYVSGGQPECIAACALAAGGWSVAELQAVEGTPALALPGLDRAAREILYAAQGCQDYGSSWLAALGEAELVARGWGFT
jgi:hypothetical protein